MKGITNEKEDDKNIYQINNLNINEEQSLIEKLKQIKNETNNTFELYNNDEKKEYINNIINKENGELTNEKNGPLTSPMKFNDEIIKNKIILSENNFSKNNNNKSKVRIKINEYLIDKKYYSEQIEKNKKEIKEFKLALKEKENYISELKSDLEDKESEIFILKLEKDKLIKRYEDKLNENEEKIKIIEEKNLIEKKLMENNLYTQIKNSEAIIRELRESKNNKENIILKYKNNINELNIKIKEIENKYRILNDEKENNLNDIELELNNYKIKISQLTNDLFLKESTIKKMNGEIQILKTEIKNNKKNKINEIIKNNEDNTNKMEIKLKESKIKIDEYDNKYNLMNKELNEAKNMIIILNKEKEDLINKNNINNKTYINDEQERELNLLKNMIQNLQKDNEILRNKMNDYEELKLELECYKNRGNNYNYIEINKSSLKEKYDKLIEENKQLKENLLQDKEK